MIRSRFSFYSFHVSILFILGYTSMGISLLMQAHATIPSAPGKTSEAFLPGVIFTAFGLLILCLFLLNITVIIMDKDRLELRKIFFSRVLPRKEIASIDLLARTNRSFIGFQAESLRIEMKNGKSFSFLNNSYRNMPELKRAIRDWYGDVVVGLPGLRPKDKDMLYDPAAEDMAIMEKFSGNYLTCPCGMLFYGITTALVWIGFEIHSPQVSTLWEILVIIVALSISYFGFGMQLFYFRISDRFLVIGNHLFYGYRKIYRLEDVQGTVLEDHLNRSDSLRIRTNDFKSKAFGAGSLRKRDWQALAKKLKSLSIPFRSDGVYLDV